MHLPVGDEGEILTLFQKLQADHKKSGRLDARLIPPVLPIGGAHIWAWFWELDAGRGYTPVGTLSAITHGQVAAWCSITGVEVRRHELEIIMAMDRTRLRESSPEVIEKRKIDLRPPMTPALFDAMFGR